MTGKMSRKKYILIYTLVFAAFALGSFFLFLKKGKSMIWEQDGGPQYYPYLVYLGQWLRDALSRALHGDFTVRMYDFAIGLGNDVGSVARTHPLEMLSALFPVSYAETLYSVIILLRLYLAGLAFSYLASLFKQLTLHTVTGSMIYVFSGFAVIFAVRHLIYGSAFIMLPLLIAGAELIIRGQKGWLFSLAAFLGFICNYYFMYQATAACGVFVLLRLIDLGLDSGHRRANRCHAGRTGVDCGLSAERLKTEETGRADLKDKEHVDTGRRKGFVFSAMLTIGRLAAFYLLGLGMSMFAMLPVVASLGASERLASQSVPQNLLSYEGWRHYYRWFLNLIIPVRSQQGGTPLNYAVTAFPALVLLFAGRPREKRVLKGAFIIGTICIFSPLCAYVLSGFSVVSNRWIFCYSLVVALAFVFCAEEMTNLNKRQGIILIVCAVLYLALAVFDWVSHHSVYLLVAAGELIACLLLLWIVNLVNARPAVELKRPAAAGTFAALALLILTFASCSVNTFLSYSGRFGNMLTEYLDRGEALGRIKTSEFTITARIAQEQGAPGVSQAVLTLGESETKKENKAEDQENTAKQNTENTENTKNTEKQGDSVTQNKENPEKQEIAEDAGDAKNPGEAFWRVDSDLVSSDRENYSLLLGYAPTCVYNSVLSGPSTRFLLETGNSDLAAIHRIQGLDSRTVSEGLASVRYYLTTYDGDAHAPYGFMRSERYTTSDNAVFENAYPLAFGYSYDTVMARSDLEGYSPLEKEQIMLEAAVLSDEDAAAVLSEENRVSVSSDENTDQESKGLSDNGGSPDNSNNRSTAGIHQTKETSVTIETVSLPLPENGTNASRTEDGYRISKGGGSISFSIKRRAGCEAVALLEDFWIDRVSNFAVLSTGSSRTQFSMRGPDYIYSLNRKDYYVRLGYDEEDRADFLRLELPTKGRYHLAGVSICYIPMEGYTSKIEALNAQSLQDTVFTINTVQGSADMQGSAVMAFSIPYSSGWKVYVDGQKAQALQVNEGWLGTMLTAGRHEITLRYTTPGAVTGRWISLAAWILFVLICLWGKFPGRFRTV